MFRSIFTKTRTAIDAAVLRSGYCTTPQIRRIQPEINDVKLVGTLINDSFGLASGTNSLTLRTQYKDKYYNHTVYTRGFPDLKAGQRLFVSGNLQSIPFEIENEKQRERAVVNARRIFVLEDGSEGDRNQVDLAGNIATDVIVKDTHCIIVIATHKPTVSSDDDGITNFHSVFVYDDEPRKMVANLKRRDRVVINGKISYFTHTLADGKRKYSYFIVANSIEKIASRKSNVDEHNIDREINN